MKTHRRISKQWFNTLICTTRKAQATLEFALLGVVGVIVLLVGVQLTLIGAAYLALDQIVDQTVRYAVVHSDCNLTSCTGTEQTVQSYMLSIGSPILTIDNGSYLSSSVSPAAPRTRGQTVTVSTTFTIPPEMLFLPNPFLGISFPTSLSNSKSGYSEGN